MREQHFFVSLFSFQITLFLSGLAVAVLAFLSYINEPAYDKFGPFAFYGCIAGLVKGWDFLFCAINFVYGHMIMHWIVSRLKPFFL